MIKVSVLRSDMHIKIILISLPRVYKRFLPVSFTNQNFVHISYLPMCYTCPVSLIALN